MMSAGLHETLAGEASFFNQEIVTGSFHANVNPKNGRISAFLTVKYVLDLTWYFAAIGAKLIGPYGGL